MAKKSSTEEFISKAKLVHGDRYDYSKVNYINSRIKVCIICKEHGKFWQRASSHLNNVGCNQCYKDKLKSTTLFIKKARKIHGDKYEYLDEYVNNNVKFHMYCCIHGEFYQTPKNHLKGQGCKSCGFIKTADSKRKNNLSFIQQARKIHGDKYEYLDEYINNHTKYNIVCHKHGSFQQTPKDHIFYGTGCTKCSKSNYSKKAITWLNQLAKEQNIYIQHAENKGEYRIPGTNYKADGYCSSNNTIYEFYGDCWHGNLDLFEENYHCHPFSNECAGSLYIKTKQREQEIIDLGYNLITIWEDEWNKKGKTK